MVGNWSLWASLGALAAPVLAVQDEAVVELPVRITQVLPDGRFEIDRGANMWLAGGDRVVLLSRDGRSWTGRIAEVREFDAVVELFETGADLAVGSQGTAYLPKARTTAGQPVPKGRDTAPTGPVLHDPWERLDEEWTRSDPLLARIAPVHPADRAVRDGGRLYGILEPRWSSEEGRSETWFRVGGHYWMENPWGRGGRFEVDGEFNRLSYHLPFPEDHRDQNLRVDRLSYALGGTRQDPWRYEVGRFLMYGMPELGLVDGGSVHLRRPNGDLMGVSMGWMPEPDPDQTPGHDFQISAFYRWSLDTFERYTAALAVQKTWHQGAQDRDLIIGRMDYAPLEGWRYHGSAWIDWYGNDELVKDSGVDLTRLRLEGSREWQGERGLSTSYRYEAFPDLLRDEFREPSPITLQEQHLHRLSVSGWKQLSQGLRGTARAGLWLDDGDGGGDLEVGGAWSDTGILGGTLSAALFVVDGQFTEVYGLRTSLSRSQARTHWMLLYEASQSSEKSLPGDGNDFYTHRFWGSYGFSPAKNWNVSIEGQTTILPDDSDLFLGLQCDWSF
ncbi:MAG: hypothetical protein R3F33_15515 [Planctomycetota bacterium]